MPDLRTRRRQWRFGVIAAATGGRQAPLSTGLFQFQGFVASTWRLKFNQIFMLNSEAIKTQILLAWNFFSTRGRRIASTEE